MAGLLPQMSLEPAPGYRRFVECHFEALRRDAQRLAGDGPDVDELCCEVLTDLALRWRWFEVLRVRLRRSDPAAAFLGVALARRIARWHPQAPETPVDVIMDAPPPEIEVVPDRPIGTVAGWPAGTVGGWPAVAWHPDRYVVDAYTAPVEEAPARPVATSAAVRIAAVRPLPPPTPSAAVEAVIAWLHAYEVYGRYRRVVAATAAGIAAAVLVKLGGTGVEF